MRIVHTADWHLGAPRVPPDVFDAALDALTSCYKKVDAQLILCVGDVFDKPKPAQKTKDQLLDFLIRNEDINFIFTLGNHDYEDKNHRYNSLETLGILTKSRKLKNVRVLKPGSGIVFKGKKFYSCETWDELYEKRSVDVVAYHGMPPQETFLAKDFANKMRAHEEEILNASGAKYVALGDVHKAARPYPGALVQKTYSCEDGILIYDMDANTVVAERLNIPIRETIDLSQIDDVTDSRIISALENVGEGNWVKIITKLPLSRYLSIDKPKIKNKFKDRFREMIFFNKPVAEQLKREYPEELKSTKTLKDDCNALISQDKDIKNPKEIKAICARYASKVE